MHGGYEIRFYGCPYNSTSIRSTAITRVTDLADLVGRHEPKQVSVAVLLQQIRAGHSDPVRCRHCGDRMYPDTVRRSSYVSDFIITEDWL